MIILEKFLKIDVNWALNEVDNKIRNNQIHCQNFPMQQFWKSTIISHWKDNSENQEPQG